MSPRPWVLLCVVGLVVGLLHPFVEAWFGDSVAVGFVFGAAVLAMLVLDPERPQR